MIFSRWIAHRGAGKLAPENTLAAFKLGAHHGYRQFECDVKLSADEQLFLLHDETLNRTTNGNGIAGDLNWSTLSELDAGSWHSPQYQGERLPLLQDIAQFCLSQRFFLNLEIKPSTGLERRTGECVAELAQALWKNQTALPLMTSFKYEALAGAKSIAPQLPRGLILNQWQDDAFELSRELACTTLVCHHRLWTRERVEQAHRLQLNCFSYTVNHARDAERLQALHVDALITDEVQKFAP